MIGVMWVEGLWDLIIQTVGEGGWEGGVEETAF